MSRGHHAHVAVTQGQRLIQLVAHRLQRAHQPVGADLVQHHADFVGLLAGLVDEAGLAEVNQHALSAGGNQCARSADQQPATASAWAGDIGDFSDAGFEVLEDLFHQCCVLAAEELDVLHRVMLSVPRPQGATVQFGGGRQKEVFQRDALVRLAKSIGIQAGTCQ